MQGALATPSALGVNRTRGSHSLPECRARSPGQPDRAALPIPTAAAAGMRRRQMPAMRTAMRLTLRSAIGPPEILPMATRVS